MGANGMRKKERKQRCCSIKEVKRPRKVKIFEGEDRDGKNSQAASERYKRVRNKHKRVRRA